MVSTLLYSFEELKNSNASDWEELNEKSVDGSFFHTLKWMRFLERFFRLRARYFLAYRNEQLIALFPFFERRVMGFSGLVTLPYLTVNPCNHIVMVDEQASPMEALREKCGEITRKNHLSFAAVGLRRSLNYLEKSDCFSQPTGNMILNLSENNLNRIWNQRFSKKGGERKMIRRFKLDGFEAGEVSSTGDLKKFYTYYGKNLLYLHARPFETSYFEQLIRTYSAREIMLSLVCKGETIAGGYLAFLYDAKKTMYLRYLALNRDLPNRYRTHLCLNWHAVRKASEMGYRTVHFGGTPNDPTHVNYRLKKKFGCKFEQKYILIIPSSPIFKVAYRGYKFAKQIVPRRWRALVSQEPNASEVVRNTTPMSSH